MKKVTYALLPLLLVAACSAGTNQHPSPPVNETYRVTFPSNAAAVAAETLQVFVFDAAAAGTDCASLLLKRKSGSDLGTPLATTDSLLMCDVFSGEAVDGGTKGVLPTLTFGSRAFLAVTQRTGKDFFIGCATTNVAADSPPIDLTLGPANATVTVPATSCTLQTKCAHTCQ